MGGGSRFSRATGLVAGRKFADIGTMMPKKEIPLLLLTFLNEIAPAVAVLQRAYGYIANRCHAFVANPSRQTGRLGWSYWRLMLPSHGNC